MRKWLVLLTATALALISLPVGAAEVNVNGALVGAFPIGAFGERDNIIYQAPYGWSARGGGAGTGLGFNLEIETQVGKVTWIGFRFGYVEHGADASAVKDYINSIPDPPDSVDEITALDGSWTNTFISFPVRFVARDFNTGSTYLKFDFGWVKVGTQYEGTVREEDPPSERPVEAEFNYGNKFFLAAGLGADFRVSKSLAILAEVKYVYMFTHGSEATSTVAGRPIRTELNFDLKTVEVVVGVRIPVGGI
jgi:opacity protein-like surface antigen